MCVCEIIRCPVPYSVRNRTGLTRSAPVLLNLVVLVADWLITFFSHIMVIHKGFSRDGDITEIIPAPWQHKPKLQIFMCKLCCSQIFRITGYFETSALNNLQMTLNIMTSQVPRMCSTSPHESEFHSLSLYY